MGFLKLLGGPLSSLVGEVGKIIDSVSTTDTERLEAQRKLVEIERSFQLKLVEFDADFAKTQASVIEAETKSESVLARNWRPILMLVFTYIILHRYVLTPLFNFPVVEIPVDMWDLLKLGMTGYIVGRSAEKVLPEIAAVLKK